MSRKRRRPNRRPAPKPPAPTKAAAPPKQAARRVSSADERPPAPWGSFPLAELVIFAGIVALIVGLIGKNPTAIGAGVVLAGLGGLEVAIREHFAGYRSHTTLLAGAVAVTVAIALLYLGDQIIAVCLAAGAATFAIVFFFARRAFQRASGGLSFRIGKMRS